MTEATSSYLKNSSIYISVEEWKSALEKTIKRTHIIGAWIAIIFDPIFGFTDYLNIPDHFPELMAIRLSVSILTFIALRLYLKKGFPSWWIVLVPFVLISFQNSYTFMLIEEDNILGHCLNYIALFLGGGMFILWPMYLSVGVVVFSFLITFIFFGLNAHVGLDQFWVHGGLLLVNIEIFMIILIQFRYRLTVRELKAKLALEKSKNILAIQKAETEKKNELILDSIQYAKRIQDAILGDQEMISSWFKDSFILFKPKDIVSGDFYFLYKNPSNNTRIVVGADCTGHGVPAALMTVLGNSLLTDIIEHRGIYKPDQILKELDNSLIKVLKKRGENYAEVNDGMDISILSFIDNKVYFSSAKNPLIHIRNGELEQIKGSKFAIGGSAIESIDKSFELHEFDANQGDKFYIYSDGFQDQFGGPKNKKYMTKKYRNLLLESSRSALSEQKNALFKEFTEWKGEHEQTDDLLVIGIEV